jgi:hypothetical protein
MIKIEGTVTPSPEQWYITIMGARNAMNSWDKSDSEIKYENVRDSTGRLVIGPEDMKLLTRLRNSGTDERKFMRMLTVHANITAPLYWWKEYDTYKVATVANSCSTMHKIHSKEFTLDDFSYKHLIHNEPVPCRTFSARQSLCVQIEILNMYRELFLKTKDKKYWWQMIQLLPSSYNQKRTVMLNYEVLANMYKSRKAHKLDEWREMCKWIEGLPYSELITGKEAE